MRTGEIIVDRRTSEIIFDRRTSVIILDRRTGEQEEQEIKNGNKF